MLEIKLTKIDFIAIIIMLITIVILTIIVGLKDVEKNKYINELETKVNILEEDYINFAIEDSLKQEV